MLVGVGVGACGVCGSLCVWRMAARACDSVYEGPACVGRITGARGNVRGRVRVWTRACVDASVDACVDACVRRRVRGSACGTQPCV